MLRHMLATLAYRAAKVLRDAPPDFAAFSASASTRQPTLIVAHMADLMAWGLSVADGGSAWRPAGSNDWQTEVERFLDGMKRLDARLMEPVADAAAEKLIDLMMRYGGLDGSAAETIRHFNRIRNAIQHDNQVYRGSRQAVEQYARLAQSIRDAYAPAATRPSVTHGALLPQTSTYSAPASARSDA